MDNILLKKRERELMLALKEQGEVLLEDIPNFTQELFNIYAKSLELKGLVGTHECEEDGVFRAYLTEKGDYYLSENPTAKNPFLTPDRKWIIATLISVLALVLSIIALLK